MAAKSPLSPFVTIVILFIFLHRQFVTVQASWWLLGMQSASHPNALELKPTTFKTVCKKLNYLVDRQQEICTLNHNILQTIGKGAKLGIDECQHQFQMNRWNCSTFDNSTQVFGGVVSIQSREKAYIYAVSAAGVAYSITKACSMGHLTECGCDDKIRTKDTKGKWEWGGCSDDIRFGASFSKDFVDASEDVSSPQGLMNVHNNEAGRRALKSNMELVCKCHGVSGSCTIRVCWRKLKTFRAIGDMLIKKFDSATQVKTMEHRDRLRLKPAIRDAKKPSKKDLVFLDDSPDYCTQNETIGVFGTRGRECNATSYGMDGCKLLCCGRGYQTVVREVEDKCNCKFVWCCKVNCETCMARREFNYCN
ncbi:Protein Wnt-5a [Halotydeus destructor]|nr:Protein Wnt-5a [Halotydeus destructor]